MFYEAALAVGPFGSDPQTPPVEPQEWGPFPADVFNGQRAKTQPGLLAPVDGGYLDPRRFTRDGAHPNELGAALLADQIVRNLTFSDLDIGRYDLDPFFEPVPEPPNWEGRCPSPTTYRPLPLAGGGTSSGEGEAAGEGQTTGEGEPADEWVITDEGLPADGGA